jgi:hypothetical protein
MKSNDRNQTPESNTAPVHTATCGRVRAAVWQSTEQGNVGYKVTISRSFNRDGKWTRGRTYFPGVLAAVVEVCAKVQRWIEWQQREAQKQPALAGT